MGVGLKSTNWVVGPSDTAQHLNSQEQNSKRSVVGPDVGTFPEHQKIPDCDLAEGREQSKIVKSVLFVGHHGNQKFFCCTFGQYFGFGQRDGYQEWAKRHPQRLALCEKTEPALLWKLG